MLPRYESRIVRLPNTLSVDQVLQRICVRPPYFALSDTFLAGTTFGALVTAEAPAYLELGPMTAAELGRHAAIAGVCHTALSQTDDKRRYYLAQEAECRYFASTLPYGTPIRLQTELSWSNKRESRVTVKATAEGMVVAGFEISYTILTEPTFERLFRSRLQATPLRANPYGQLLQKTYTRGADWAEQIIDAIPVSACVGHFDNYPALPVAVLMGQLSYLAGQMVAEKAQPFRVIRGSVRATDLAWAGETVRFRVERAETLDGVQRFTCSVHANERQVGAMDLWLQLVECRQNDGVSVTLAGAEVSS